MKTDVFFLLCFKRRWIVLEDVFWDNDQRHKIGLNIYIYLMGEKGVQWWALQLLLGVLFPRRKRKTLLGAPAGKVGPWVDGSMGNGQLEAVGKMEPKTMKQQFVKLSIKSMFENVWNMSSEVQDALYRIITKPVFCLITASDEQHMGSQVGSPRVAPHVLRGDFKHGPLDPGAGVQTMLLFIDDINMPMCFGSTDELILPMCFWISSGRCPPGSCIFRIHIYVYIYIYIYIHIY